MSNFLRGKFRQTAELDSALGHTARLIRRQVLKAKHKPSRQTNTAMLHAGRCGSSVLADMLNQHPDMRWANEPFENMKAYYYNMPDTSRGYNRIADSIFRSAHPHYGFDSKYLPEQHLRKELANKTPVTYAELLKSLGFNRCILLDRKNHLRRAASIAIGTDTKQWGTFEAPGRFTTTINLDRFVSYGEEMPLLDFFSALNTRYSEIKDAFRGMQILELTYENDILVDPTQAYIKSCDYIGIKPQKNVAVRLRKQNPLPLSELIENYDEVASLLHGTEFEWMLTAA